MNRMQLNVILENIKSIYEKFAIIYNKNYKKEIFEYEELDPIFPEN